MSTEKSRGIAAQAWCTKTTGAKVMDVELAEAFADILATYIAQNEKLVNALASFVGVNTRAECEQMDAVMRLLPMPEEDRIRALNVTHVLRDVLPT